MCFAINLYNALVIHALVVHGPEQYKSTLGRLGFFSKVRRMMHHTAKPPCYYASCVLLEAGGLSVVCWRQ